MARAALYLIGSTALVMFIACGGDDNSSNPGSGGSTSKAGSSSTAGSAGTGTPTGGTGTGGTGTGGTGTGGTSTGGTAGSSSAFACLGTEVTSPDITDFAGATATGNKATWTTGVPGGTYVYPEPGDLTADFSGESFKVSGSVGDYSGMGLYFDACMDASAYEGISFDISGDVGASGMVSVRLQINSDEPISATNMKGGCAFASAATQFSDCVHPSKSIAVPEGGGTITIPFSDFAGGKPTAAVDPAQIIGVQWAFDWAAASTEYAIDVTVDNVKFTGAGTGTGGSPGTGGAGGGG